jgi:glycosyltransferase involved in cell wall biosynthesis
MTMDMDNAATLPAAQVENGLHRGARIVVLFRRFGPYHHARLNAAGKSLQVFGVEACGMEDTYAWSKVEGAGSFTRITLTDREADNRHWKREIDRETRRALNQIKPQAVVVPGWSSAEALSALAWCAETRTPAIMMSESTAWDEVRSGWKEWIKQRLVGICSAGLAGGTAHENYLVQLGLEKKRIFKGYDIVDNDYFATRVAEISKRKAEISRQYGLPENYFLASARFVEKKNLPRLLAAYARYRALAGKSEIWNLVLLGDGPLREILQAQLATLNLRDHVRLPGFIQYDDLPAYFGLAGAFVHASTTEQWGLVVNEAMASGLPVLVSDRCGCAMDLVDNGVNGFTFDPLNVEQLAEFMLKISGLGPRHTDFGSASRKIISEWGPERFANGLGAAVEMALANRPPAAGLADRLLLRALIYK